MGVGNISSIAALGRNGDTQIGHLTPGEIVVPKSAQTPGIMAQLASSMRRQGKNPASFVVGGNMTSQNPITGFPEFADAPTYQNQPNFGQERIHISFPGYDPKSFSSHIPRPNIVEQTIADIGKFTATLVDDSSSNSQDNSFGTPYAETAENEVNSVTNQNSARGSFGNISYGSLGDIVGKGLSLATRGMVPGLSAIGAAIGTGADQYEANKQLSQLGYPTLGFGNYLEGFLAEAVPFANRLGLLNTIQQQQYENFGIPRDYQVDFGMYTNPAFSWDQDIANAAGNFSEPDDFGGWGGYEGAANVGPGADYESDPGDAQSSDGYGDGQESQDEAEGEDDMGQDDY